MTEGSRPVGTPAAGDSSVPEIDLRSVGGQPPPAESVWLVITAADSEPGGAYSTRPCPGPRPTAFGGDVLVNLAPGRNSDQAPSMTVAVWTAARGALVPVAAWALGAADAWAIFTMSAMTALAGHADLGEATPVDLTSALWAARRGLPPLEEYGRSLPLP